MVDNYIACLEEQRHATDPVLSNSYKNRLLYSLLGAEGIAWFASHPMAAQLREAMFEDFSKESATFSNWK